MGDLLIMWEKGEIMFFTTQHIPRENVKIDHEKFRVILAG